MSARPGRAKVHADLLDQLSLCGMHVMQKRVGRYVLAVCFPDPERCELTGDEEELLHVALTEIASELPDRAEAN